MLGKKKLGSAVGALALVGGFMGAAGVSVLTATSASADPPGAYSCTVTDTNTGNHVVGTGLTAPATAPVGTISGVTPGDIINFTCTGLAAHESVAVIQAAGLAGYDSPSNETSYADIGGGNLGGSSDASGNYNQNLNSAYTNADTNLTAPPSLVAVNLGAPTNLVTAADEGTENPLILVNLSFTGGVSPTPTNINLGANYVVQPNTATTPLTAAQLGTTGYWWGAGEEGTGGSSPIPNPSVLIDGATPIASAGTAGTGSSTLSVSAGTYTYGAPGTPHYPVLGGGIVLPKGLTPGVHSLTVAEGTLEAGNLTATTTFFLVTSNWARF